MATFDIYEEEKLSTYWQEGVHLLKGLPYVNDIRNYGLMAAIDFEPVAGMPAKRAFDVFNKAFFDYDLLVRPAGVGISLSPPLIVESQHIDELIGKLTTTIKSLK